MISKHDFKGSTWVELDSPTEDEVRRVMDEHGLHIDVARDLTSPSLKQSVRSYGDHIYLVLHFPTLRQTRSEERVQEIDFVIGKDYIVTANYDSIQPLNDFSKVVQAELMLGRDEQFNRPQLVFFGVLRSIYRFLLDESFNVEHRIGEIERNIFKGRERDMVLELSTVSRDLLDIKRVLEQHDGILGAAREIGEEMFGEDFSYNVSVIAKEYEKVRHIVRNDLDLAHDLRDTNNSLITTKQNEVMKIFSIMAFFTFPLALITAVSDMSLEGNPFEGHPYGFWLVVIILAMTMVAMVGYFRHKKWI